MDLFHVSELIAQRAQAQKAYFEFLRVPALSAGVYRLVAGAADPQSPHHEDEVYHVVAGRALLRVGDLDVPVGPGSVVFVKAEAEHRFHSITEDMTALVLFAPAETP